MPLWLFEILCVVVIVATLAVATRRRPIGELARDYAALAVAGWVGEESCILLYRHYAYADGWHFRVHEVPLLVPLIWPLVILSAREVAEALTPRAGRVPRALAVGAVVLADASMVEVLAVRAELWSWAEGGHLGVPLIGILGWALFAVAADLVLGSGARARHLALVLLAPLATHALLVVVWWGLLRWVLRGDLGHASLVGLSVLSVAALALVLAARRRGDALSLEVAGPRMLAASLFFALLVASAPGDLALWAHVAAVAVPYVAATRFTRAAR